MQTRTLSAKRHTDKRENNHNIPEHQLHALVMMMMMVGSKKSVNIKKEVAGVSFKAAAMKSRTWLPDPRLVQLQNRLDDDDDAEGAACDSTEYIKVFFFTIDVFPVSKSMRMMMMMVPLRVIKTTLKPTGNGGGEEHTHKKGH